MAKDPSHRVARPASPPALPDLAPPEVVKRRITTYTLLRLLLATALFGLATYMVMQQPETVERQWGLFALIAVTYLVMGASAALVGRMKNLEVFVTVQLVFDALLIATLVAMTGGPNSIFFVLFFMNIGAAAYLGYGRAALATAGVDGAFYLIVLGLLSVDMLPGDVQGTDYPETMLRIFGIMLVGILTGRLSERVRLADEELVRQRETTRMLEEEHGLIVQSVRSGILTIDENGNIRAANPAAMARLGLVEGRPLERVLPKLTLEPGGQEFRVRGPDGNRTLLCYRSPLGDHAEVVVFEDVTQIREMEAEMEREERLVGVGKIAAAIAHEIRNPLASLSGAIQLLKEEAEEGPLLDIALREIHRLNDLVGDFLEIARPPQLRPQPTNVTEVLDSLITTFVQDPRYGEQVTVVVDGDPGEPILLDPNRLRQVLWNLLLNAAQAMPDGGMVHVHMERIPGGLRIQVSDHGVGVDSKDIEKLFDPFYTTRQGGTGLGLVTVNRLVRAHGGWVKVQSEPGRGTTFEMFFPDGTVDYADLPTSEVVRRTST